MMRIPWKEPAS